MRAVEWVTLSATSVRKVLAIRVYATPTPGNFSRTKKRLQGRRKVPFEPPHLLRRESKTRGKSFVRSDT